MLVNGGIDLKASTIYFIPVAAQHFTADHLSDIGCFHVDGLAMDAGIIRLLFGGRILFIGYEFELVHPIQHIAASLAGTLGIDHGVVTGRGFGQAGQGRRLRQGELCERFTVIDLGCGTEAIGTITQENLVQIQGQNVLFTQLILDFQGEEDLIELTQEGLFPAQKEVTSHLHGNRAATGLLVAAGFGHLEGGAQDTLVINAGMDEKAVVLGGQDRMDELLGELLIFEGGALHLPEFGD